MTSESAYFMVEGIHGKSDIKAVKKKLDALHGVTSVSVREGKNLVAVDYDSSGTSYDEIEHSLNQMGYQIIADESDISTR